MSPDEEVPYHLINWPLDIQVALHTTYYYDEVSAGVHLALRLVIDDEENPDNSVAVELLPKELYTADRAKFLEDRFQEIFNAMESWMEE